MQKPGFTFIELLCVLGIASLLCVFTIPSLNHYIYSVQAKLTMQQIQQAISYGRSQAIAQNQIITICPSNNNLTCSVSWDDGLLVVTPNGRAFPFKLYICAHCTLSLSQSGFVLEKITIQASGMTHQNGKFDYKSVKFSGFPQFNLYFNKALRIYMLNG